MSDYLQKRREHIEAGRPKAPKKNNWIKPFSKKRTEQNELYKTARIEFLKNRKRCEAKLPGCTKQSVEVHHKSGRVGKYFLDIGTWLPVCRSCHRWIEANPEEAKTKGLSRNRLD